MRDGTGNTAELPIPAGCGTVPVPIPEKAAVPGRDRPLEYLFISRVSDVHRLTYVGLMHWEWSSPVVRLCLLPPPRGATSTYPHSTSTLHIQHPQPFPITNRPKPPHQLPLAPYYSVLHNVLRPPCQTSCPIRHRPTRPRHRSSPRPTGN